MNETLVLERHLPLSESGYYILVSLTVDRHGYGIMQNVDELTGGRLRIGAGTLYGTMQKLETEKLIEASGEIDRRKMYRLTDRGWQLLTMEIKRLEELVRHGHNVMEAKV